ncbi:hypothetical protein [Saccharopolyspora sp. 5N708]|uniref:hypothetical protein n=1 Tax=Saccharopolyspora sp. 5N708 TaxID=3457424 RepID=UPI003FD40B6D
MDDELRGGAALPVGTLAPISFYVAYQSGVVPISTDQGANLISSMIAFCVDVAVSVPIALATSPKTDAELEGLVYSRAAARSAGEPAPGDSAWYRRPAVLGWSAIVLAALCYLPFSF